ncbi:MAG: hypothetical protein ACI8RD_007477 [Bacillariaceae sp.]|jgi:hypothetical protein
MCIYVLLLNLSGCQKLEWVPLSCQRYDYHVCFFNIKNQMMCDYVITTHYPKHENTTKTWMSGVDSSLNNMERTPRFKRRNNQLMHLVSESKVVMPPYILNLLLDF